MSGRSAQSSSRELHQPGSPVLPGSAEAAINDDRLTDLLATRVLGWKLAPDRFLKPDRGWTPRWQFAPFHRIEDAFMLLERAADDFTLELFEGVFTVQVRIGKRSGKAVGAEKARTISLAVAAAIGVEIPR